MGDMCADLREWLLDLIFPRKCPFCRTVLDREEQLLCRNCQRELPWLEGKPAERKVDFTCGCWSPLAYRGNVPEAVRRYKFRRVRAYGVPFGKIMAQCAEDHMKERPDLITWAPLSKKRLKKRGFDQARLLAETVGEELKLPVRPLLKKKRHNGPQSRLDSEAARRANALGAYELLEDEDLSGKKILLVDDVVTSGATLSECARLLCQNGADVYCLTLAQARSDHSRTNS